MNMNDNRRKAHDELDHVFKDLFPARDMAERPAQSALSHKMLDAMVDGGIALCDAGTGIGKTYAYLTAGTVYSRFRADCGLEARPILISTSSIALQNAVRDEYLPFLSAALLADEMVTRPIQAVIRKGKAHYVCDERLEHRLQDVAPKEKNKRAKDALLSMRDHLDSDEVSYLALRWFVWVGNYARALVNAGKRSMIEGTENESWKKGLKCEAKNLYRPSSVPKVLFLRT